MVSIENVSVSFGGVELFSNISLLVNDRDKIGLVGRNGAGKSTMLKLVIGEMAPETGRVVVPDKDLLGYLPQTMIIEDKTTVFKEAEKAFDEVLSLNKTIEKLTRELGERTDYESEAYHKIIVRLTDAHERFDMLGGGSLQAGIEQTLQGLGFLVSDFDRPTSTFSGGWRMRIELAKILLRKPEVLLLDEPTNHLDIESIQWLEDFLKSYTGSLLLISHDRAFLDAVTNRTVELTLGNLHDYKVSYSRYVELRKERREQQMAAYRNQQKMLDDTRDFIERFRYKATKAVQVQSRIKQMDKVDIIEVDEEDTTSINIKFPPAQHSGRIILEAHHISKTYDTLKVLSDINLIVEKGEKIAFVGKNGEGKTTFSRIVINELEHEGKIKLGHNVKIGYFAQNQDKLMNGEKTVFQTLDDVAVGDIRTKVRDILGAFLFRGDDIEKKVSVLSGGERSRLAMAKLLLEPYNLLVLDEPTNHLDMHSKDILKNALLKYDGTLLIVSHDREFLDGLVNKVYEFTNKNIKEYLGGIYYFLNRKKITSFKEIEKKAVVPLIKVENKPEAIVKDDKKVKLVQSNKSFDNKMAHEEKKEFERQLRKLETVVKKCEEKIHSLETQIETMNAQFANPDILTEPINELYLKYDGLKKELETEMMVWEKAQFDVDELKEKKI